MIVNRPEFWYQPHESTASRHWTVPPEGYCRRCQAQRETRPRSFPSYKNHATARDNNAANRRFRFTTGLERHAGEWCRCTDLNCKHNETLASAQLPGSLRKIGSGFR